MSIIVSTDNTYSSPLTANTSGLLVNNANNISGSMFAVDTSSNLVAVPEEESTIPNTDGLVLINREDGVHTTYMIHPLGTGGYNMICSDPSVTYYNSGNQGIISASFSLSIEDGNTFTLPLGSQNAPILSFVTFSATNGFSYIFHCSDPNIIVGYLDELFTGYINTVIFLVDKITDTTGYTVNSNGLIDITITLEIATTEENSKTFFISQYSTPYTLMLN